MSKHLQLEHATALPHLTAARIILNSPHIVDEIMNHATRATLVACLRVNRDLHDVAGKVLYHTIRINAKKLDGLLMGVSVKEGEGPTLPESPVMPCFKNSLLSRTRVLSMGNHRWRLCTTDNKRLNAQDHSLRDAIKRLLSGVRTVRIVLPQKKAHLGDLCQGGTSTCGFLHLLHPKVVLVRNVCGLILSNPVFDWPLPPQSHVFWVLPSHRSKRGDLEIPRLANAEYNTSVQPNSMVFHDKFEKWTKNSSQVTTTSRRTTMTTGKPFSAEPFIRFFHEAESFSEDHVTTVYGLETVDLLERHDDAAVKKYLESFPLHQNHLTSASLQKLVIHFVQNGVPVPGSGNWPSTAYTFKTLADFTALDTAVRRYVLCDDCRF
ncbi:uncharacterized protein LOC62_01G001619 [Vanrija pseudolonga]|uniref:Uncharacterized protein n=1 Tax=Vanrija pseudolonga TaxID=143232 RepID=A0AAF0Y5E0_9TREE|nr:hypothetical protein LOC62_01G001619 [Vanrija pseudolonga]